MSTTDNQYKITRHSCPRNCYDTCSMLAYVQNGILKKVDGDPKHCYTNGKLCAKGYSYVNRVYHPDRLKTPMMQTYRGSGRFIEISWDNALDIISDKILALHQRYNSHKSLALNKYSGNFGILHNAAEGMFNSLGATTQAIGSPCWSAGLDANIYDFGDYLTSDPEHMSSAKVIILWGVNPAWTAVHSLPYIFRAKEQGATIVVIDPIYTTTAKKSDIYVQINPSADIYLAMAIAKIIYENKWYDEDFINKHCHGWDSYSKSLAEYDLTSLASLCGQSIEIIEKLAALISCDKPVFIWTGFGLQRHLQGGKTIRAINALAALTGNIGIRGGGVQFAQQQSWEFNYNILMLDQNPQIRTVDINNFANELSALDNPPVKFLWISCRNLLTQSPARKALMNQLAKIDFIVTVDQFMTPTAQASDIVLPTTTQFEEWDIAASYWHHWISINQPAIKPYYDSKSELEIAQLFAKALNAKQPNTSSFPISMTPEEFIDKEFNTNLYNKLGITNWRELLDAPRKYKMPLAWEDLSFSTPSGKFEFLTATTLELSRESVMGISDKYPYWFLTPHAQFGLNSQFQNLAWIQDLGADPCIIIHPTIAQKKSLTNGSLAKVYNQYGDFVAKVKISTDVSPSIVLFYQGWYPNSNIYINDLVPSLATDMGKKATGSAGVAFYNAFVDIQKL